MRHLRNGGLLLVLVLGFVAVLATPGRAEDRRFNYPRINGIIVDHCVTWATNCGRGGANQYCRRRGFNRAVSWSRYKPGQTWVIGSRRACNGNFCVGFRQVTCRRGTASLPTRHVRFRNPRINGAIVDHCATWATNCGWGGANQYCRRRGFDRATNWTRYRPGRTWVIGSRRFCNGGGCVGFSQVTCRRRTASSTPPTTPLRRVRFRNPRINGAIVDHCATWATNCGRGGANQFCRRRGFDRATNWRRYRPGRTWVIGSRRFCNGGNCVGFSQVTCQRRTAYSTLPMPPVGRVRFRYPKINGLIVDHCATWATNCGRGGANQFCRRRGFSYAVSWLRYQPGRTWVIGSRQVCNGSFCVGFRQVTCQR